MSPHLLAQLEEMGFGRARASRALHFSGGEALDAALTWLADHAEDADLDEEVLVPRAAVKVKLSPEEARAQAAELLRRAKERRERDERESERLREQERVRWGRSVWGLGGELGAKEQRAAGKRAKMLTHPYPGVHACILMLPYPPKRAPPGRARSWRLLRGWRRSCG